MKTYLLAYDITHPKRLRKIRQIAYAYAIGGQKSSLELPLTKKQLSTLIFKLEKVINKKYDKINIIEIEEDAILLGRAQKLEFSDGVIIL